MRISDELLARYFKGDCTPEEKLSVVNYLNENENLPDYLLKKSDWDDAEDVLLSNEKSEALFAAIKKQTITKALKLKRLKIISAAAIVLVMCTIGFLVINKSDPKLNITQTKTEKREVRTPIVWKSFVNYTGNNQALKLPDGSTVKIYPGGELRYAIPFVKRSREIYLKGKSFFEVTKDKAHPFIVYSKGISTMALGTSFTITANESGNLVKVDLHTGKVWVKNIAESKGIISFSKILLPGNELVYNKAKQQIKVLDKGMLVKESPKINELNFNQSSLKDVFEKLQDYYKIKIVYNDADLDEISFTGTIDLNRMPEKILKEITELNKLNQNKTNGGYLISK